MQTLTIQDLPAGVELDRQAMTAVRGGVSNQAAGTSQANVQSMAVAANVGNASGFGGPATIQSDNTFTQNAANYNSTANVDAFLVLGRLGLVRAF
jgi:hypothetical protein